MILCMRADSPEVYLGLWHGRKEILGKSWQAGRELSSQILDEISNLCEKANTTYAELGGYIVYEGPGSYTGLRISMSVANALAYSSQIPITGSNGDKWIEEGIAKLSAEQRFTPIVPVYGNDVYTTKPKK